MISTNLYRNRARQGLRQSELAKMARIPQSAIANIENGHLKPGLVRLGRLETALGLKPGELLQSPAEPKSLGRFEADTLCRSLVLNDPDKSPVPIDLWTDLVATFYTRLSLLSPNTTRRHPRLRAGAAQRRCKAILGTKNFNLIDARLAKFYPESQ